MDFYIYENWQAGPHKAVSHVGSCGYCNDGHGRAGGYDSSHAKWDGPYHSLREAQIDSNKATLGFWPGTGNCFR